MIYCENDVSLYISVTVAIPLPFFFFILFWWAIQLRSEHLCLLSELLVFLCICLCPGEKEKRRRKGVTKLLCEDKAIWYCHTAPFQKGWGQLNKPQRSGTLHPSRLVQTWHNKKMECWQRPLGCEGAGNSKQYFLAPVRLSNKGGRYMNYLALM